MGKINLLDDRLINKIAAGEVVENPASVIKELCENSIDAGSTSVTIEFSKGGTDYIRIADNGSGMDPEDSENAFIRHATSKLKNEEDLEHIATMGFRGEALASISEVSEVELTTSNGETGTQIVIRGGKRVMKKEVGFPRGTTIEVRNLFFNTPARKKFLKSPRQETTNILDLCQHLILANPSVSIRVINGGRPEMRSPGTGKLIDAITAVYGKNVEDELFEVNRQCGSVGVCGYASKPAFAQLNRRRQSFFVNSRYVKAPLLSAALDEAFKNRLMINKYPWAVLSVSLPYEDVDVNVHPQKTEVRFGNSRGVFEAIVNAINSTLDPDDVIPEVKVEEKEEPIALMKAPEITINVSDKFDDTEPIKADTPAEKEAKEENNVFFRKAVPFDTEIKLETSFDEVKKDVAPEAKAEEPQITDEPQKTEQIQRPVFVPRFVPQVQSQTVQRPQNTSQPEQIQIPTGKNRTLREAFSGFEYNSGSTEVGEQEREEYIDYKLVGVLWDTYIIVQCGEECYVIDQHAAHERFLYDKYTEEFLSRKVLIQQLLIPETVEAEPEVIDVISENSEVFERLGFEVEPFGNRSIIVRGVPSVACEAPFSVVLEEAIELIKHNMSADNVINDLVCQKLMQTACKHAVKGNQKLTDKEIQFILRSIKSLKGLTCPHGRPIAISISRKETEKRFGRIQN